MKSLPLHELLDPFAPDARRVQATLAWYKRLFLWAANEAVSPTSTDERASVIDRLIRLIAKLRSLGSGVYVVLVLALRSPPVARLRSSWKRLPSRAQETLSELLQQMPRPVALGGAGLPSLLYFLVEMAEAAASQGRVSTSAKGPSGASSTLWNVCRVRSFAHAILLLTDAPAPHGSADKALQDALLSGSPPPPALAALLDTSLIREPPSNERLPRFPRAAGIATVAPFLADLYPAVPVLHERDWRVLLCRARIATFVQGDALTKEGRWPGGYLLRVKTGSVTLSDAKGDKLLVLPQQLLHLEALLHGLPIQLPGPPIVATATAPRVEMWQIEPNFINALAAHKPRLVLRLYRALAHLLSQRLAGTQLASRSGKVYETSLEVDGDAERHAEWEDDGAAREALGLGAGDAILKRFPCVLKGSVKDEPGTLLVSANGAHFVTRSRAKKASLAWHEITAVEGGPPDLLTLVAGKRRVGLLGLKRDPRPLMQFLSPPELTALSPNAGRERVAALLTEAAEMNHKSEEKHALSRKEWKLLSVGGRKLKVSAGDVVAREGERSTVYRIRRGVVRVERAGFVLGTLGEGHAFGEAALFGLPSAATFVAAESVQLAECDYLFLASLPDSNPPLALKLYQQLAFSLFPLVGRLPVLPAPAAGGATAAAKPGVRPQRMVNRIAEPAAIRTSDARSLRRMNNSSSTDLSPAGTPPASAPAQRGGRTLAEVKVSPRPDHSKP